MKYTKFVSMFMAIMLFGAALFTSGCIRPVKPVTFAEADSTETMFVVPLIGENKNAQVKFDSEEYYNSPSVKVAVRKIQEEYVWVNKGRFEWTQTGEWQKVNRVIKVDRSPVNVKLLADTPNDSDAVWVESKDSIGFSVGVVMTAYIKEEDAAKFLYMYRDKSLENVLKNEVRNSIAEVMAAYSTQFKLDDLRAKKDEMMDAVRNKVVPFYAQKGITIQTLGQFGGITYENKNIQEAIDKVFIAEQEKATAKAALDAVKDINKKSEDLATQQAKNARLIAQGEADAILSKREAEAKGISLVNDALEKASKNPMYAIDKSLNNQRVLNERWDGKLPVTIVGSSAGLNMFLNGVVGSPTDNSQATQAVVATSTK